MTRHFDQELTRLHSKLLQMAGLVEQEVHKAVAILRLRDSSLVPEVLADDKDVDRLEIEIDDICVSLLALRQPMAIDLRFIFGAIKINNDLERIGDHAVNIAQSAERILREPDLPPLEELPRMTSLAMGMMKDSLDAFVARDVAKAKNVCERDDLVDWCKRQILLELSALMSRDAAVVDRAMAIVLISRNLERIADLSTNIAEETIFISSARVIKHHAEEASAR
jgi:phosphate transport system protein